eukprot:gene10158-biopygen19783
MRTRAVMEQERANARQVQPCPRLVLNTVESSASTTTLDALESWDRWSGGVNFVILVQRCGAEGQRVEQLRASASVGQQEHMPPGWGRAVQVLQRDHNAMQCDAIRSEVAHPGGELLLTARGDCELPWGPAFAQTPILRATVAGGTAISDRYGDSVASFTQHRPCSRAKSSLTRRNSPAWPPYARVKVWA